MCIRYAPYLHDGRTNMENHIFPKLVGWSETWIINKNEEKQNLNYLLLQFCHVSLFCHYTLDYATKSKIINLFFSPWAIQNISHY